MLKADIVYDKMFEFDEFYPYQLYREINRNDSITKSHFLKIFNTFIQNSEVIKMKETIRNKHLIYYYSVSNSNDKIFTIGYEKTKIEDFIGKLRLFNIKSIIDVRENPFSLRREFSKRNLIRVLHLHNIRYVNYKELGSPREFRQKLYSDNDYASFFRKYEEYLGTMNRTLEIIVRRVGHENSALLCLEKDINRCHRSIIVKKLKEMNPEFNIFNI